MKSFIATATICMLLILPASASAQTRTRRSAPQKKKTTTTTSPLDATRFNAQRIELAGVSKDLTRFLYLYGRLSKDLELTGAQAESSDAANRTRSGLISSVQAMRDRLDQLESHFRFAQGLESQYRMLQGISGRADEAAQSVNSGQYDRAGRVLLEIATQLTDVLLDM
ncbi:MAG TPA: hypothetical protein VEX60_12130 [Pyrinomonadaceae bacterium]|nr:hypothetical protein [Pyrinomonadaceae bacterium]